MCACASARACVYTWHSVQFRLPARMKNATGPDWALQTMYRQASQPVRQLQTSASAIARVL
eukprot:2830755-Alexandrium_andersonii.AAC.1